MLFGYRTEAEAAGRAFPPPPGCWPYCQNEPLTFAPRFLCHRQSPEKIWKAGFAAGQSKTSFYYCLSCWPHHLIHYQRSLQPAACVSYCSKSKVHCCFQNHPLITNLRTLIMPKVYSWHCSYDWQRIDDRSEFIGNDSSSSACWGTPRFYQSCYGSYSPIQSHCWAVCQPPFAVWRCKSHNLAPPQIVAQEYF